MPYLFWAWNQNGGGMYFGYFSRKAYAQPYHSKGLGESFPLMLLWTWSYIEILPKYAPPNFSFIPKTGITSPKRGFVFTVLPKLLRLPQSKSIVTTRQVASCRPCFVHTYDKKCQYLLPAERASSFVINSIASSEKIGKFEIWRDQSTSIILDFLYCNNSCLVFPRACNPWTTPFFCRSVFQSYFDLEMAWVLTHGRSPHKSHF